MTGLVFKKSYVSFSLNKASKEELSYNTRVLTELAKIHGISTFIEEGKGKEGGLLAPSKIRIDKRHAKIGRRRSFFKLN